ncbi:hypothetical protein ACCT18_01385 [Rhizobium ruizarguesonis]
MAVRYECMTGRHAGDLTLGQLSARMATLMEIEKHRTVNTANAVAVALSGSEKDWEALTK